MRNIKNAYEKYNALFYVFVVSMKNSRGNVVERRSETRSLSIVHCLICELSICTLLWRPAGHTDPRIFRPDVSRYSRGAWTRVAALSE